MSIINSCFERKFVVQFFACLKFRKQDLTERPVAFCLVIDFSDCLICILCLIHPPALPLCTGVCILTEFCIFKYLGFVLAYQSGISMSCVIPSRSYICFDLLLFH